MPPGSASGPAGNPVVKLQDALASNVSVCFPLFLVLAGPGEKGARLLGGSEARGGGQHQLWGQADLVRGTTRSLAGYVSSGMLCKRPVPRFCDLTTGKQNFSGPGYLTFCGYVCLVVLG